MCNVTSWTNDSIGNVFTHWLICRRRCHLSGFIHPIEFDALAVFSPQSVFVATPNNCGVWSNQCATTFSLKHFTNTGNTEGRYVSTYSADITFDVPGVLYMKLVLSWLSIWSTSYQNQLNVNTRRGNVGQYYQNNIPQVWNHSLICSTYHLCTHIIKK